MAVRNESNELKITRLYDAPVKAVWDAWTDPAQVAQWWGPRGFTLTTHSKDLRVGGIWHYTMHGPDGVDYPNKTLYHEVIPLQKLVYDHGGNDERAPLFRVSVTFTDVNGKTRMDMTMTLPTPEAARETEKFIRKAGGHSTWDRLAEYLDQSAGVESFFISRSFDAPIETLFEVWTKPEHLSRWSGPTGATIDYLRADIREGGSCFYRMTHGGSTLYGRCDYRTLQRPSRLVYTQQFCDEKEHVIKPAFAPTWPTTMLTEIDFASEAADQTRITIRWQPTGDTTLEEVKTFIDGRAGMTLGWSGSFEKLEAYLEAK